MSKLIGTSPNQAPSNADLGTLAYQNADNVSLSKLVIGPDTHGYSRDTDCGLLVHNPMSNQISATTKGEMTQYATLTLQPTLTNSTHMSFAQVNGGNGMGIQVTNAAGTANWDIALNPFGGQVGIGRDNPHTSAHLDVNGSIKIDNSIYADSNYTSINQNAYYLSGWKTFQNAPARRIEFGVNGLYYSVDNNVSAADEAIGWQNLFKIEDNGNIGIGTGSGSPLAKLHIKGSSAASPASSAVVPGSDDSEFLISGTDAMMDLLSLDDNSTVATSIGMGRYRSDNGQLIDKWGIINWYDTGNTNSNLSERLAFHYGTNPAPWGSSHVMSMTREGRIHIGEFTSQHQSTAKVSITAPGIDPFTELSFEDDAALSHLNLMGTNAKVRLHLGTMDISPYAGYIQASYDNTPGTTGTENAGTEPLFLNPLGGQVVIADNTKQPMSSLFEFRLSVVADDGTDTDGIASITDNTNAAELVTLKKNTTNNFGGVIHKFAGNSGRALSIERAVNTTTGAGGTRTFNVDVDGQVSHAKSGNWDIIKMDNVTDPTITYYGGGNGFNIQTAGNHYAGIRTRSAKYRYVRIEADIANSSSDHFGMFWGADADTLGLNNGVSGYKWVYRGNNNRPEFRTINQNNTFLNLDTLPFTYNDGQFHRWVLEVTPTGVMLWADGQHIGSLDSAYAIQGYCGFHTYNPAGPIYVRNANITSLDGRESNQAIYTSTRQLDGMTGIFKMRNGAGEVQEVFIDDGWMLIASNNAESSTFPSGTTRRNIAYTVRRNGVNGELGQASPNSDYLIGAFIDDFSFSNVKVLAFGRNSTNGTYDWSNYTSSSWISATWGASSLSTVVPRSSVTFDGNDSLSSNAQYFTGDGILADYNNSGFQANSNQTTIGGVGTQGSSGDPYTGCYLGHGDNESGASFEGWYNSSNAAADSQGYTTWVRT